MMIFVYGENAHFVRRKVEELKTHFTAKFDPSGMNLVEFPLSGGDVELGSVVQAMQTPPFLGEKRMVVVRGLISKETKASADPWIAALERIPESTIAVFEDTESMKKFEKRILFTEFSKHEGSHVYPYGAVDAATATQFAVQETVRLALQITRPQLSRVVAMIGNDILQIENELQKLAAYANNASVTEDAIQELIRASVTDQMFALMDAVSNQDTKTALTLLEDQRASGSTDFHLFAMLLRQLRLLIAARDVLDRNPRAGKQDLANALQLHPFVAQKSLYQAKRFTSPALRALHHESYLFDLAIKTGKMKADIAVDRLVVGILKQVRT